MQSVFTASLAILASGIVGGVLPFVVRRSDRLLHLFIAFATGVFLGTLFLDLLPEVARLGTQEESGGAEIWAWVLAGFLFLYLLEVGLLSRADGGDDHRRHAVVGYASWLGLCAHSFFTGLGVASVEEPEVRGALIGAIIGHKAAESFSLATVCLLAGWNRRRGATLVGIHALVTPLGLWLGSLLLTYHGGQGGAVLTALAAGTFLFVALCDLLPEVFHHRVDGLWKVALLGLGVAVSSLHWG